MIITNYRDTIDIMSHESCIALHPVIPRIKGESPKSQCLFLPKHLNNILRQFDGSWSTDRVNVESKVCV